MPGGLRLLLVIFAILISALVLLGVSMGTLEPVKALAAAVIAVAVALVVT
jgi:hypothetical protein